MAKIKYLILISLFISFVCAETKKIYFYTTETNINDFKSLKINFDEYLKYFGDYDFQAFNKRETFEKYIEDQNIIVILSSWHYKQIAKKYNLDAKLVALKKDTVTDTKIIVGKKGLSYDGTITTAFSKEYAKEMISDLTLDNSLNILNVPKEIDALMSVGFGMSKFALVSKESFELLKKANSFLTSTMQVYKESKPSFRMLIASKLKEKYHKELADIFTSMDQKIEGKKILDLLGVDRIVVLGNNDLKRLGGEK